LMTLTDRSAEPAPTGTDRDDAWWRRAVIYQVYIRSFADGNGDGTGDIAGLRSRLPYLRDLGVDAVWINPWYTSPLHDGGYDVADYRDIDERFGTIAEARELIADAHEHGIKVLVDLVPNHTSSEHVWFQAALAAGPESTDAARYHFVRGRGDDGELPPNDWPSVFGGPAWTHVDRAGWATGWWYLHLFDTSQPDLNWDHSDVLEEFDSILRFWLDLDADGFRVDVAHALVKAPGYPDLGELPQHTNAELVLDHPFWDRDGLHEIVRRWRRIIDSYDTDSHGDARPRMFVAEATIHATRRPLYLRPDEYHQAFDFDLLDANWSADEFGAVIERGYREATGVGSIPSWVLSNHDQVRHATRYALPPDTDYERWMVTGPFDVIRPDVGARRARAATLVLLGLPGAAYLYQGEELGLPEAWDLPVDVLDDPVWRDSGGERKGRDGCRVPLPWASAGASLGFGAGDANPWLPQPEGYADLAVDRQDGAAGSTLELYRSALRLRRELLTDDESLVVASEGDVLRFERRTADGTALVGCVNFGTEPVPIPVGDVVLASDELTASGALPTDTAVWVHEART
ncbi:MAG: glycoside hydrolase family 13 protein, partial [Actinomycetota bacterium]